MSSQQTPIDPQTSLVQQHPPHLQTCDNCDAPLDGLQRYCLNCGTRSRYVGNPALDYFAGRRKPSRLVPKDEAASNGPNDKIGGIPRDALPWLAGGISIALIFGVLFGSTIVGGKSNNNDAALLAALARQNTAAAPTGATTVAATTTRTSDFTLDQGYAVQLSTLPSTSDQAAADTAKQAAAGKGAKDVGLISQSDFTVTPAPADGAYIVYSGQFKKKGDAQKALKGLKAKFPDAVVISVAKAKSDGTGGTPVAKGDDGKVAHDLTTYKPSAKKIASDKKAVDDLQNKTGETYRDAQKNLPAEITIPKGNGGGATGSDN
jgi:hypothetical protein